MPLQPRQGYLIHREICQVGVTPHHPVHAPVPKGITDGVGVLENTLLPSRQVQHLLRPVHHPLLALYLKYQVVIEIAAKLRVEQYTLKVHPGYLRIGCLVFRVSPIHQAIVNE